MIVHAYQQMKGRVTGCI